jgi:putative hydrolase of the HAD superfamily
VTVATRLLANHPELVSLLASWFYTEWGGGDPPFSLAEFEEQFRQRLNRDHLPLAMVALLGNTPVATASLKLREMDTHPQYTHWLGGVYTLPEHRRQGIGAQVIEATVAEARRLGVEDLYLYTRRSAALYARLGWQVIERPVYHGRSVAIMRRYI